MAATVRADFAGRCAGAAACDGGTVVEGAARIVTVDITVLIAALGSALYVGTFFVGRMTAVKKDG